MNIPSYEPQVDKFVVLVNRFLKKDPKVLVEIGAKDCKETVALAEIFPFALVHAYEPDPITIPQCRERVKGYSNIVLHEMAVSDVDGTLEFNVMPDDPGSSSIFIHKEMKQESINVPSTTLEKEFLNTTPPDALWLDTQGAELKILKGAGRVLKGIALIHSEVYFNAAYKSQPLYKDIRNYLNSQGFDLLTFSSTGRNFADAIFINRRVYRRLSPQWTSEFKQWFIERMIGHVRGLLLRLGKAYSPRT